jgi:hypothetical protein
MESAPEMFSFGCLNFAAFVSLHISNVHLLLLFDYDLLPSSPSYMLL